MILMRENIFRGPLEGVGPENRDFLGPEMATSKALLVAISGPKKLDFQAPPLLLPLVMDLTRLKSIMYRTIGTLTVVIFLVLVSFLSLCFCWTSNGRPPPPPPPPNTEGREGKKGWPSSKAPPNMITDQYKKLEKCSSIRNSQKGSYKRKGILILRKCTNI